MLEEKEEVNRTKVLIGVALILLIAIVYYSFFSESKKYKSFSGTLKESPVFGSVGVPSVQYCNLYFIDNENSFTLTGCSFKFMNVDKMKKLRQGDEITVEYEKKRSFLESLNPDFKVYSCKSKKYGWILETGLMDKCSKSSIKSLWLMLVIIVLILFITIYLKIK